MNNRSTPLVSVVFTSYNHKEYVKQALDSIVNQTYQNIEIIVIDDCSTDGSQEILRQYQSNPKIFTHLLDKNTGSYVKSSNYGASLAKGEYLLFAQCDDYAEPTQVETLVNAIENSQTAGVCFCRSNLIDAKGKVFDNDFRVREKSFRELCATNAFINKKQMRRFLSKSCVIPNLSAALIKRELYLKINGIPSEYLVAADWAFWLELSEHTDFFYIATALNNFRQHNTTIRNTVKIKRQILEIYSIFYKHIGKYQLEPEASKPMRIGAASIWIAYFSQGPKSWIYSFPSLLKTIFVYERNIIWYLFVGTYMKLKEFVIRDSKNGN